VLGTLADRLGNKDIRTIILSGDLDMLQLVRGELIVCRVIKTGVTETELYDEARVMARFGVTPSQLPDYKGLVGDQSDGIPGIAGIGPKTATKLIQEFGSLEEIFENEALLDPKINKKLAGKRSDALFYRALATIRRDVPIKISDIASLALKPLNTERLRAYFHSLGFESLARRLDKQA
jgi:DNA polymerase-1